MLKVYVLTADDAVENEWTAALQKCFPSRWRELAATAGEGLRKLLASGEDLQEAAYFCANGLLSQRNLTTAQLGDLGRRLLVFAIEPLEHAGKAS